MNVFLNFNKVFATMIVLVCTFGFVSCSDDDDVKFSEKSVYGNYKGSIITKSTFDSGAVEAPGTPVTATVEGDKISFEKLPLNDLVLSLVNDEEQAEAIIQSIGDISYEIAFKSEMIAVEDSMYLILNPEPLKIAYSIPASEEGVEETVINIEVQVAATQKGCFAGETSNLTFALRAEKLLFGQGEELAEMESFKPLNFNFDLKKTK